MKIYKFRLKSLKLVFRGPINNILVLIQIVVWHRPGDKPLSEPMMVITDAYMRHSVTINWIAISLKMTVPVSIGIRKSRD